MFARKVSIHLKPNTLADYSRTFESDVLPTLRKQNGFIDEITLSNPSAPDVIAISIWENKAAADAYTASAYPSVLKAFARVMDGTPKVDTFGNVATTFHKSAVAA